MQTRKGFVYDFEQGKGELKHYYYWTRGIKLTTKKAVVKAINLGLKVMRKDRTNGLVEVFNYKELAFEVLR